MRQTILKWKLLPLTCLLFIVSACARDSAPSPKILVGPPEAITQAANNLELAATLKMIDAHQPLRVPEVSDPGSASNRRVLDALTQQLLLTSGRSPAPAPFRANPTAPIIGALETDFSVDNRGTGEYTVWLSVPESRASLAPSPSITYYSNSGVGVLGWRFAFSTGFYHGINRGRSILARDDETRSIEFSAADKYYLDGKRLICITPPDTHGKPGSRYRTEVDSFVRILAHGEGDNITGFTLINRHGRTFIFGQLGETTDGYQPAYDPARGELDSLAYEYALKRVEDTLGNWVEFDYQHFGHGEWHLTHIAYTGGPDQEPLYHIRLSYQANGPAVPEYFSLRRSDSRMFLDSVKVHTTYDAVPVAQYKLGYAAPAADGARHLTSINGELAPDIGALTQALPPILFHWSEGKARLDETSAPTSPPALSGTTLSPAVTATGVGDFNADGKLDHLILNGRLAVTLSNKNGFGSEALPWLDRETLATLLPHPTQVDLRVGDLNGDGLDDVLLIDPAGRLLALRSDGHQFLVQSEFDATSYFTAQSDAALPSAAIDSINVASRVHLGDMTGDGREDLVIHDLRGRLHCFTSHGDSFSSVPFSIETGSSIRALSLLRSNVDDMNGDGNADYIWIELSESSSYQLRCVLVLPEGELAEPFTLHEWPAGPTALVTGDFNGDSLPDFLTGSPPPSGDHNWQWSVSLNRGMTTQLIRPLQSPVTTFSDVMTGMGAMLAPPSSVESTARPLDHFATTPFADLVGVDVDHGLSLMTVDTNDDGLEDLVFHRPLESGVGNQTTAIWWTCHSRGDGSFRAPHRLTGAPWTHLKPRPTPDAKSALARIRQAHVMPDADINGDGLSDWVSSYETVAGDSSTIAFSSDANLDPNRIGFKHLVTHFADNYGRTLDVAYRAAKDDSIYTPGAPVEFPIRELRSSTPVVSEVWHDAGGNSHSQFSYKYAANRIDFSGRGGLGFAIFATMDRITGFFKFQQVEHSFPMTGLMVREESYRSWNSNGQAFVKILSSTDYANVFDLVRDPFSRGLFGTIHPFNSQYTEREWPYDDQATYQRSIDTLSLPPIQKPWIPQTTPGEADIINITRYWFDEQVQSLPPIIKYPTNTLPWVLAATLGRSSPPEPPPRVDMEGAITYGNQRLSYLDYGQDSNGQSFFTRESTVYHLPSSSDAPITGLVSRRSSSEYMDSDGTVYAPIESFEYFAQTALLSSSLMDSRGATSVEHPSVTETIYERDERGRLTTKRVTTTPPEVSETPVIAPEEEPDNRVYVADDFDDYLDLPSYEWDLEDGNRTMRYNSLLLRATETNYTSGGRVRLEYDELNRLIHARNLDSDYLRTTQYEWTTPDASDWRRTQTISPPSNSDGIVGTSVFAVRVQKVGEATITSYYDRLDRAIRVRTESLEGETTYVDTVFNILDSAAAETEAYDPAGTVTWSVHHYDAYGQFTKSSIQKISPP